MVCGSAETISSSPTEILCGTRARSTLSESADRNEKRFCFDSKLIKIQLINIMLYFGSVCELLENVQNAKGNSKKLEILKEGFVKFRNDTDFNVQANFENFYQGIRLIVPELDHGRKTYNMKEYRISRTLIKMLNLGEGVDKKNLLNHSKVFSGSSISLDFADIVHTILRKYISQRQSTVTVADINNQLDLIANRDSDTKLDETMLQMFRKLSTLESKWIIRILLKKLKLGINNNKILNVFHPDAVEYYSSNTNLKKVCETLWNSSIKLNKVSITIFEHFQPMLSKRSDAESFLKDFQENETYFVETKFDGERFQLHMDNGKFKYFSRNGFDITTEYGENFSSGIFTRYLKDAFDDNVKRIILDGEMMLWHKKEKKFGSKGMTFDVKKLKSTNNYQPCFCVFDILLLNDKILTNTRLVQRLKYLQEAVKKDIEGIINLSQYKTVKSRQEIIDILNKSMDEEQEGIVVKKPNSIYKYKDRKSGWYKIKMEYFQDGVTDMDLILMGAYHKDNSKTFKSFLVGVLSTDKDKSVISFGKVSSGLNSQEMDIINEKFSDSGIPRDESDNKIREYLIFGKDIPDIWLDPNDSLIFTVRATELIRCNDDSFRTPYTMRFPRILKIRNDKPYQDCLSLQDLLELCQKNKAVIKLNKKHLDLAEIQSVKRTKRPKTFNIDTGVLERTSNFLNSIKFFVASGNKELGVGKIEELIQRYGGSFGLTLEDDIQIVIAGEMTWKVTDLLKKENKFDVVKFEWLQRTTTEKKLLKYKQEEVISIGASYYNCLADDVDKYGDSYSEELSVDTLRSRFNCMAKSDNFTNLNNSIIFKADLPVFYKFKAYFDRYETINDSNSELIYNSFVDEIEFKYRLGTIADILDQSVNLIIIGSRNGTRKEILEDYGRSAGCTYFQVVESLQLYNEEDF